jgi:acetyltransferase-like isoleucine patch superfamily enzyme
MGRLMKGLKKLFVSLQEIDARHEYLRLWLTTTLIWICVQANFYFIVMSMGYTLSVFEIVVVSIIMVPMTLLPFQGFANLGTHEIGWTAAFALFGYPPATALAIAVSSHIVLTAFVLMLGGVGLALLGKKPERTEEMKDRAATPRIARLANFIFDRLLPAIRWLLFPFGWLAKLGNWTSLLFWLLANESTKRKFKHCGRGVRLNGRFRASAPGNISIGDNVHINENAFIRAEGGLSIGSHTHISRNLVIYTMNHQYEGELLPYDHQKILKPVTIGENVWIGMNVSIVPGVSIGDGAIIGLGTLVSQDVPRLAIVGSAPMRIIKQRDEEHYNARVQQKAHGGMSGHPWE